MTDPTPLQSESMVDGDTTIVVAPGPLLPPTPRVLQRQASDVSFMSPEILREKLLAVGYQEPVLRGWSECAVDGCHIQTLNVVCLDCEMEIEALAQQEEDKRLARAFWLVASIVIVAIGVLMFTWAWCVGWLP